MEWMPYEEYLLQQQLLEKREQELWDKHRIIMTDEELRRELYYVEHGYYPED